MCDRGEGKMKTREIVLKVRNGRTIRISIQAQLVVLRFYFRLCQITLLAM